MLVDGCAFSLPAPPSIWIDVWSMFVVIVSSVLVLIGCGRKKSSEQRAQVVQTPNQHFSRPSDFINVRPNEHKTPLANINADELKSNRSMAKSMVAGAPITGGGQVLKVSKKESREDTTDLHTNTLLEEYAQYRERNRSKCLINQPGVASSNYAPPNAPNLIVPSQTVPGINPNTTQKQEIKLAVEKSSYYGK
ncbi:hypothetical protein M3Y96_00641000 [Aphelenchoides besseyi]|nr:hypothetical protein M3Y96_00641000 [Aphelenchoides besseyi]